jgi:hypothetical protein
LSPQLSLRAGKTGGFYSQHQPSHLIGEVKETE